MFVNHRRAGRFRALLLIRLALLAVLLIATFAFHASGTTLAELRIARFVLVIAVVAGFGFISRRRRRGGS